MTDTSELLNEIERLRDKCNKQARMLQKLMPIEYSNAIFIHTELGTKDSNNMPERLLVVPCYGSDISYVYVRTNEIQAPEW